MTDPKSQELLEQFLAGQDEAATAIFDRYVARLLALARTRISAKLARRIDPEDVVQSAYRSFFVHAQNDEYQLRRSGDLWRLLARTTLNKLYGQIEKQTAEKRSINREVGEESLAKVATREPTIAEVVSVAEQLSLITQGLSQSERTILLATLQGQSLEETAKTINKSERTVRRLLAQARQKFEEGLLKERLGQDPKKSLARVAMASGDEPLAPLRFSDYVLEELVGAGGMGKVYRATNKRSGKLVAFKALHKFRQQDERAVGRFVQESRILAKLQHTSIVGVEGLGRFPGGGYFLVMDFVAGTDLQSRLNNGPLPVPEAVAICRTVALAVGHAHDQGIIHCDLKPANVLVDVNNQVVVTDFGFAWIIAETPAGTQQLGGTAGYIPPELFRPQEQPTRATDIYALGAMLWNLLTGKVPAELAEVRGKKPETEATALVCRSCLALDPADRFATTDEFLAALDALQSP